MLTHSTGSSAPRSISPRLCRRSAIPPWAIIALLTGLSSLASGKPVTWYVDSPTGTGSFVFDADLPQEGTFGYVGVVLGSSLTANGYVFPVGFSGTQANSNIYLFYTSQPLHADCATLSLFFNGILTDKGGTFSIVPYSVAPNGATSGSFVCALSCTSPVPIRSGTVSTNPVAGLAISKMLPAAQAGAKYPLSGLANLIMGGTPPYDVSGITGLPAQIGVDPTTGNVTGLISAQVPQTYLILGSVSDSSSPALTAPINSSLQIFCGNPKTNGDDRDVLIQEYIDNGVTLYPGNTPAASAPRCTDLTQQHPEFNVGSVDRLSWWMVWAPDEVSLLNTWETYLSAWGAGPRSPLNSGYRTPDNNFATPGAATRSQHMFGKAIDMPTLNTLQDWTTAKDAANQAGRSLGYALWFEPKNGPCKLKCFHADVRRVSGAYLNP
jgi:Peptidase M15